MNKAFQNRHGTRMFVDFPDFPTFAIPPRNFTLIQETGKHDIAEITFSSFNNFYYKALKTGVPVQITWVNEKGRGTFTGYVHSSSMKTQASIIRLVTIKCVGSSFVLKEGGTKIWRNKTASEIVTDLAKQAKLKPVITSSTIRFAQQSLIGHTYWEKIQELAHRIGYVAQVVGVELHFHPMDKMIDSFISSIPVLSYQDGDIDAPAVYEAQTLDMFKPLVGDLVEIGGHSRKDKTVFGIDPLTAKTYSSTSSPNTVGKNLRNNVKASLFKEYVPTRITDNATTGKAMSEAQAQLARWSIPADGSAQGDARIAPYRTVEINGTGDTSDGFWIITRAEHFITFDGRYNVEFKCVSDGTGGNKPSAFRPSKASVIPTRNIDYELATGAQSTPTSAKISSTIPLYNETQAGFNITPRRWVGR
jgi:hypothetical protein